VVPSDSWVPQRQAALRRHCDRWLPRHCRLDNSASLESLSWGSWTTFRRHRSTCFQRRGPQIPNTTRSFVQQASLSRGLVPDGSCDARRGRVCGAFDTYPDHSDSTGSGGDLTGLHAHAESLTETVSNSEPDTLPVSNPQSLSGDPSTSSANSDQFPECTPYSCAEQSGDPVRQDGPKRELHN